MTVPRGSIVVAPNPFGWSPARPYVVVSNEGHPFADEESICLSVTTTARDAAIPLDGEYAEGELPRESYVSPWSVVTLKNVEIDKRVAAVSDAFVDRTLDETDRYVR